MKFYTLIAIFISSSMLAQKNTISTNLPSYGIGNLNVSLEREIVRGIGLSLQFSHLTNGDLPLKSTIKSLVDAKNDQNLMDVLDHVALKGNSFIAEVRLYTGKKGNSGFYFAPYYKHSYYNLTDLHVNYMEDAQVNVDGHLSVNSLGLLLGSKWVIGNHFVIDWWIGGGHVGKGNVDLKGTSIYDLSPFEHEIEQSVKDITKNFYHNTIDVDVEGKEIRVKGTTDWYGIRGGLAIGYTF